MATITSQDMTLEKLFSEFYLVPDYQREYVWGEKEVMEFMHDIYEEFSADYSPSYSEYFIGSIIVCGQGENVYEVIDGQQRMTTAYLVLCGIRDLILLINPQERLEALKSQIAFLYTDDEGNDQFRHRVTLQYGDSRGILEKIAQQEELGELPPTRSVQNIKNAYDQIVNFLRGEFGTEGEVIPKLRKFYADFIKKVKLIRVTTSSVTHALRIYATLNHRGVPLDDLDLLKNLMFAKAHPNDYETIKVKWKQMVDLLFQSQEPPMRFLRYFILAKYANKGDYITESSVYDWFLKHEERCGYQAEPLRFVEALLTGAKAYIGYLNGRSLEGEVHRYLVNIRCLSVNARQHLILLLAGQHLPPDCFTELCRQVENLMFVALIASDRTKRAFDGLIIDWATELRHLSNWNDLQGFIARHILPGKERVSGRFELAFRQLNVTSVKPSQLRYILGKLTQYIDEQAWGSGGGIDDLMNYIRKLEIEYILPINPSLEVQKSFDKNRHLMEVYAKQLGNLTLLEKSIHSVVSQGSYEEKKNGYTKSKFLLTRTIAEGVTVEENTAIDLAVKNLETFEVWNSESIEKRQEMLTRLAKQVWDMP